MTPSALLVRSLALAALLVAAQGARRGAAFKSGGAAGRLGPSTAAPPQTQATQQLFQASAMAPIAAPLPVQAASANLIAGRETATNLELAGKLAAPAISATGQSFNMEQDCSNAGGFISFELITGYVLAAPASSMQMQPGTLQLTDCLNICRQNATCLAINFETGLCVLLQESADKNPQALQKSQFPVFTIYAHKICIQGERANRCHKSWSFERVLGWALINMEKKSLLTKTRLECLLACYNEQAFQCKSFNYDSASGNCQLSDMDRHSMSSVGQRRRHYVESPLDTLDYGENNCIQEARGICDFKPLPNRILKTVDSIYQDIKSEPECRKRCLQAPYRCHSYDLGDQSNPVCRLSHLDRNSLQQIQEPYLEIQGASSYELDSCYNVTVVCRAREMVAKVRTNKLFNGKIYAKNAPLSCVNDISNSLDFELPMAFANDACAISRSTTNANGNAPPAGNSAQSNAPNAAALQSGHGGQFSNEIVLQHNDMIVTNADIGLNVKCHYDLRNQTVYNNINLDDFMAGRESLDIASQSQVVRSPNISMQILRHDGNPIQQAQVGDPLMLRFHIQDSDRSPFEIFVRDLYAMDGHGQSEIQLIDSDGCPTDPSIMAAMQGGAVLATGGAAAKARSAGQTLEAQFDAFKFPTSETVAFRALVTPCIPHCEPVHCQNRLFDGSLYEAESFGKKRRRRRRRRRSVEASSSSSAAQVDEVLLRNSIQIKDKLFPDERQLQQQEMQQVSAGGRSLRLASASACLFAGLLFGQLLLVSVFALIIKLRRRRSSLAATEKI